MTPTSPATRGRKPAARVVICGGGVAAIEALLALRSLLALDPHIDLIAPNRRFVYQPVSVAEPFGLAEAQRFELASIAVEQRAQLHRDSLAGVEPDERGVVLAGGASLTYDALIVAVGAHREGWLEGALHFGGAKDVPAFRGVLERVANGDVKSLAFVSPAGVGWTLPMYELALLTASWLVERRIGGVQLMLVTPESEPLNVFGPAASRTVRRLLSDAGIDLHARGRLVRLDRGRLKMRGGGALDVDEVVAMPELRGPKIPGLPSDADGFIAIDEHCRVAGLRHVYAAGDGTGFPVKQGGIASQQADAAAEAIAASLGAAITPAPFRPMLRGLLLTGIAPRYLRARPGDAASSDVATSPLWSPSTKIAGRHLAPTSRPPCITLRDRCATARCARRTPPRRSRHAARPASWHWHSPTAMPRAATTDPPCGGSRSSRASTECCRPGTSRSAWRGARRPPRRSAKQQRGPTVALALKSDEAVSQQEHGEGAPAAREAESRRSADGLDAPLGRSVVGRVVVRARPRCPAVSACDAHPSDDLSRPDRSEL
jgi:sulfide:quinone oxidoreductase